MSIENNEVWCEKAEDHPIYVSWRLGEGIIVRIEDRKLTYEWWSDFRKRVRSVRDNNINQFPYDEMSSDGQATIDFLAEVLEKHDDRMSVIQNV